MSENPTHSEEARPAPKQDPEALVLRGRPRPVVRFRRGLIIGAAAFVSAGLVAVTWLALEPPSFQRVAENDAVPLADRRTPDALANVPATYGDVPRLGPPLPGDLGRPILEHERSLAAQRQPDQVQQASVEAERARAAADAERQRRASAQEAARASGVMVQLTSSAAEPPPSAPQTLAAGPLAISDEPRPTRAGQAAKIDFVRSSAGEVIGATPAQLPSPWTLSTGTVIPASFVTGLNSDLPGLVIAQVTEPVRDSATGRIVLIPQGSRLIGNYDSVVAFGQKRALLVWQKLVLPDGSSIGLESMPATDVAGYAGVKDRVDFHTWRLLKGVALSTLLGVGTELSLGSGEGDLVRAIRESAQQNAARAGDQITQRNLDLQPTLTVRPGWPVRAIVHKDLVLRPWKG